ncbi:MAG: pyridoxamine 5'-phosphate oxidase family protein [Bacteroidota bacterium]|nr:pyridoxamine 5'-phosphate oxidase family protein [Bacteroidota bacterium]
MKNRELTFKPELEEIIRKCDFCNLAMVDEEGKPYVLPMNFGYHEEVIYLHSARQGRKIDILKKNPEVCISFSTDHKLNWVNEEVACSWSMKYKSVLAYGKVEFIDDMNDKREALDHIMANYSDRKFSYNDPSVRDVQPFKVIIERMDGRAYGY